MVLSKAFTQVAPTKEQLLRHDALRKQAEKFVSQTFFQPMFKMMRSSPFKSEMFNGGQGGEAFQSMLDGVLAERMGRGAGHQLVDAIVEKLDPGVAHMIKFSGVGMQVHTRPPRGVPRSGSGNQSSSKLNVQA